MNEFDCDDTEELVCPYCGCEEGDSWELEEADDKYKCGSCERYFAFDSEATRTFSSWKVPCLNGEPHLFKPIKYPHPEYANEKYCAYCRKRESGETTPKEQS